MRLEDLIANAIRASDRSFFREDYAKQARAVVESLRKNGYEVVPKTAPGGLIDWAKTNLPYGRQKPEEFLTRLYAMLVENVGRFR